MSRMLSGALMAGLLSIAFPVTRTQADGDKNKCTIALKDDNEIVKACQAGGIKRAKVAMKSMQRLAKEKGLKHECDDCHKDEAAGDWTLTKEAEEKFKKMLELVARK